MGNDTDATVNFAPGFSLRFSYPPRLTPVVEATVALQSVTLLSYPILDVAGQIDGLLPGASISILDSSVPENVYSATVLSTFDSPGDNNWIAVDRLAPVTCDATCEISCFPIGADVIAPTNTRDADEIQINVTDTSGNNSSATDKDGDGQADFDELELWSGGLVK
jgi:hypothetical protein